MAVEPWKLPLIHRKCMKRDCSNSIAVKPPRDWAGVACGMLLRPLVERLHGTASNRLAAPHQRWLTLTYWRMSLKHVIKSFPG
jgi:hypothetical protein